MQMFSVIAQRQFDSLFRFGEQFLATHNINAALLCFDYGFSAGIPSLSSLDLSEMIPILSNMFNYVRMLHNLVFGVVGSETPDIWKVFGVKENIDDGTVTVTSGTFAHQHRGKVLLESTADSKNDIDQITIPKDLVLAIIRSGLDERLCKLVSEENKACRQAPAFSICMRFVTFGDCNQFPCPRPHVTPGHDWFQSWVRAHLLQILIYHSVVPLQSPESTQAQQRCVQLAVLEVITADACLGSGSKDCSMLSTLPITLWDPVQISFQIVKCPKDLQSQPGGYVLSPFRSTFTHIPRFSPP